MFSPPPSCHSCLFRFPCWNILLLFWYLDPGFLNDVLLIDEQIDWLLGWRFSDGQTECQTHCYPDHEAVSAVLRVSSSRVDDTLVGAMGDFFSRRPTHMAEDAVRADKLMLSKIMLNPSCCTARRLGKGFSLWMQLWGKDNENIFWNTKGFDYPLLNDS